MRIAQFFIFFSLVVYTIAHGSNREFLLEVEMQLKPNNQSPVPQLRSLVIEMLLHRFTPQELQKKIPSDLVDLLSFFAYHQKKILEKHYKPDQDIFGTHLDNLYKVNASTLCTSEKSSITVLEYALTNHNEAILAKLIQAGLNLDEPILGINVIPLHFVTRMPTYGKFLFSLIDNNAKINIQNEHGETALILACKHSTLAMTAILINARAMPNIPDNLGNTALHYAAMNTSLNKNTGTVELLLQNGADASLRNNKGQTALAIAREKVQTERLEHFKQIVRLLEPRTPPEPECLLL